MKNLKRAAVLTAAVAMASATLGAGTAVAAPSTGTVKLCADGNYSVRVELPTMNSPLVTPGSCRSWKVSTGPTFVPVRVVGKFNTSTNMFHIDTYYWTSSPGWLGLGIHAGGTTANGGQGAWSYLES